MKMVIRQASIFEFTFNYSFSFKNYSLQRFLGLYFSCELIPTSLLLKNYQIEYDVRKKPNYGYLYLGKKKKDRCLTIIYIVFT